MPEISTGYPHIGKFPPNFSDFFCWVRNVFSRKITKYPGKSQKSSDNLGIFVYIL
jgi:hypothetical protein